MNDIEKIKIDLEYITDKLSNSEFKKEEIITKLDWLINKQSDFKRLLNNISEFETVKKENILRFSLDRDFNSNIADTFISPFYDAKSAYKKEYYHFMFNLHKKIYSPNLFDKKMLFFNYQIPLGYKYQTQNFYDILVESDDVSRSNSIDTEFYQILILQDWGYFTKEGDFDNIKNRLLNQYNDFSHSDIVVTKSSKGKSRVENSFDIIKRTFKKIGIIDKKDTLTYFGLFIVKLMQLEHSNIRPTSEYRGIKSVNQLLVKPINDLIFHFDLNDFDKLNLELSKHHIDDLKAQIELYKKDAKNVSILNLPNYLKH